MAAGRWGTELLTIAEGQIADFIIRAATARRQDRVFYLGPYARRVSFASQQNRALNLLWALRGKGVLVPNQRIAVVGAGLAGVTVTAALFELGCKVTLYEAAGKPLLRQAAADHRYIHPTINRWPDQSVEETTTLPYFDWASGLCHDLMRDFAAEWTGLRKPRSFRFTRGATVIEFVQDGETVAVETLSHTDGKRGKTPGGVTDFASCDAVGSESMRGCHPCPTWTRCRLLS